MVFYATGRSRGQQAGSKFCIILIRLETQHKIQLRVLSYYCRYPLTSLTSVTLEKRTTRLYKESPRISSHRTKTVLATLDTLVRWRFPVIDYEAAGVCDQLQTSPVYSLRLRSLARSASDAKATQQGHSLPASKKNGSYLFSCCCFMALQLAAAAAAAAEDIEMSAERSNAVHQSVSWIKRCECPQVRLDSLVHWTWNVMVVSSESIFSEYDITGSDYGDVFTSLTPVVKYRALAAVTRVVTLSILRSENINSAYLNNRSNNVIITV